MSASYFPAKHEAAEKFQKQAECHLFLVGLHSCWVSSLQFLDPTKINDIRTCPQMAARLIKHLEEKAKTHSHIELLRAQWTFDQELIPKALQNVGMIFPHYSRHDASHSRQILVNIERLLGDSIEKLTATDTWLILESAYWHDIGMLVTSNEITRDIQTKEFKSYVRRIAETNGHELKAFAKGYLAEDNGNCFSATEHPQDAVEKFRQLLAGWYRQLHASRAEQIVDDPWREAGISSPRNELLPKRLFRILGSVCKLHGSSFKDVMEQLSFCEAGMGNEDCHPRFVACLLRLGDLLDLDDNRFCPVMQRTAGVLPPSSQAHVHKHASIRHFRLDRDRIEVSAVCDSTDGYVETDQWFRWLEQEIQQQMSRWNDIVPEREFGLLPTLGELKVDLNGPNIVLAKGQRPQFGVDPLKALELLQGAGLYSNKYDSVRELLQNAIDATLIYVWYAHGGEKKRKEWESPDSTFVREILERYPVQFSLQRSAEPGKGAEICWDLIIKDSGIGISRNDLNCMLQVGGSYKNNLKREIVSDMPEWMRPSGAFGIGLQSAFLISPEIKFSTKSVLTSEALDIRLTSPLGDELGLSQIKLNGSGVGHENGTTLTLKVMLSAVTRFYGYRKDALEEFALKEFDPIRHQEFPFEAHHLAKEAFSNVRESLVPIHVYIDGELLAKSTPASRKIIYDKENNIELDLDFTRSDSTSSEISFRGQKLKNTGYPYSLVNVKANFLGGDAQSMLTINREGIRAEAWQRVRQSLKKAIKNVVKYYCPESEEEKIGISAYARVNNISCLTALQHEWRRIRISENMPTIDEILKLEYYAIQFQDGRFRADWDRENLVNNDMPSIVTVTSSDARSAEMDLLIDEWIKLGKHFQEDYAGKNHLIYRFLSEPCDEISPARLARQITRHRLTSRMVGPIFSGYEDLLISPHTDLSMFLNISPSRGERKLMVLPFYYSETVTLEGFDDLCVWVQKHAQNRGVSISRIKELYEQFIKWIDNEVVGDNGAWRLARNELPDY